MPLDMRNFIAFPVTPAILKSAVEWQKLIQNHYPFLTAKWVAFQNMHVTMEFLGTLSPIQLDTVREVLLYQTEKVRPFLYETCALAAFPNTHRSDALVCEVAEKETANALHLHKVAHEELSLLGITKDYRMWRPHITLARTKGEIPAIESIAIEKKEWLVDRLQLIESQNGSRYTMLNEYPLTFQ